MPESKQQLVPQARAMYAQGLSVQDVADALGVSAASVYRWKRADGQMGSPWEQLRADYRRKDPRALISVLEDREAMIALDQEFARSNPNAWADALQKVHQVLTRERDRLGDLSTIMGVLSEYAAWAAEHVPDEDRAVLLRVTDAYLSDLKRRYA